MNLSDKVSKYFTLKEAIWLPKLNRAADASDGLTEAIVDNIKQIAVVLDVIREFFGKPIVVHCWFRPEAYNALVNGAKKSMHLSALAVDFEIKGISCDDAKKMLIDGNKLEELNLRMEDNGIGSGWIHLDIRAPGPGGRFFKP